MIYRKEFGGKIVAYFKVQFNIHLEDPRNSISLAGLQTEI
jgi:hypothetical protein